MKINYFFKLLKKKLQQVLDEGLIWSEGADITDGTWTIIFNTAVYLAIKAHNKHHNPKLQIIPEPPTPKPRGHRGGFSDFRLDTSHRQKIAIIEHENSNERKKLEKNVEKLLKSRVRLKILVVYNNNPKRIKEQVLSYKKKKKKTAKINLIIWPRITEELNHYVNKGVRYEV